MTQNQPRAAAVARTRQSYLAMAGLLLLPILLWSIWQGVAGAQEKAVVIPPPAADLTDEPASATAVFAGGCFWGVQGVFQHVNGVTKAVSGYSGGSAETANYSDSSSGKSGHAETVEITYDPSVVSFGDLLQIYFSVAHNPTQLNFQGPDYGTQYRSTIFPVNDEQAEIARAYIAQLDAAGVFDDKIVTTIEPLQAFYPAEQYHQDYLTLNPDNPYIVYHDLPKIEALKTIFPTEFRDQPVLVGQL